MLAKLMIRIRITTIKTIPITSGQIAQLLRDQAKKSQRKNPLIIKHAWKRSLRLLIHLKVIYHIYQRD